jgi:Mrp family chromosome partitioning ATPase/capsular polysaccharide biosynthesis protein
MTLRDYLHVLRRRKWIVIVPVVLAPIIAAVLAHRQPKLYQASAQVMVSRLSLPSNVLGFSDPTQTDAVRLLATQAQFARLPSIAQRAVTAAGVPNESASDLLAASTVTPSQTDDFLTFAVSDAQRARATRLATAYAGQYVAYFRQYQSAQLAAASKAVQGQIQQLQREGRQSTPLYANLVGQANQLAAAAAVAGTTGAVVSATDTSSAGSNVLTDALFALVLALVVGLGLAFLRDALDPRVRSAEEMGDHLQLRLLGRLPRPPRSLRRATTPVTLADPESPYAEPYRMLRTSVEFMIGRGAGERTNGVAVPPRSAGRGYRLMVTSALAGEGKSTTIANLGVAFAQAGRKVLLVDLDFRRSSLTRFFGIEPKRGLADVITGSVRVSEVVSEISLTQGGAPGHPGDASEPPSSPPDGRSEAVHRATDKFVMLSGGRRRYLADAPPSKGSGGGQSESFSQALSKAAHWPRGSRGSLRILPFGTPPPHTLDGSLLNGIGHVLDELKTNDELVLIDSPPLLSVGDALALTSHVDGLLVIGSLRTLRAPLLKDLRRVIDGSPVDKLGFILTGAELEGGYEYLAYRPAKAG